MDEVSQLCTGCLCAAFIPPELLSSRHLAGRASLQKACLVPLLGSPCFNEHLGYGRGDDKNFKWIVLFYTDRLFIEKAFGNCLQPSPFLWLHCHSRRLEWEPMCVTGDWDFSPGSGLWAEFFFPPPFNILKIFWKAHREIFYLLAHSTNYHNSWEWVNPKSGTQNSIWISHKSEKYWGTWAITFSLTQSVLVGN